MVNKDVQITTDPTPDPLFSCTTCWIVGNYTYGSRITKIGDFKRCCYFRWSVILIVPVPLPIHSESFIITTTTTTMTTTTTTIHMFVRHAVSTVTIDSWVEIVAGGSTGMTCTWTCKGKFQAVIKSIISQESVTSRGNIFQVVVTEILSRVVSTAMLTRDNEFSPSVCPSRSGIVSKRLNVSSQFFTTR